MAYLVLAFPEISPHDFDLIQEFRKFHDEYYWKLVDPHFTLVFSVNNFPESELINEFTEKSKIFSQFNFVLRCATINKDAFKDDFYDFLVPDEGYSRFIKLHDALHSGLLFKNLRLDIDYIPHITIGMSQDKIRIKKQVDQWNSNDFSIAGKITELTIVNFGINHVKKVKVIPLK
jgi:hypothetical protein